MYSYNIFINSQSLLRMFAPEFLDEFMSNLFGELDEDS